MNTKTLGVCGCSWMAATKNGTRPDILESEGKHFTEILAKRLGWNYFTLARSACSNTTIRLQIDESDKKQKRKVRKEHSAELNDMISILEEYLKRRKNVDAIFSEFKMQSRIVKKNFYFIFLSTFAFAIRVFFLMLPNFMHFFFIKKINRFKVI